MRKNQSINFSKWQPLTLILLMVSMTEASYAQLPGGLARTRRIHVQAPPTYKFIDRSGKQKIPYKFHLARPFSEGLAPVLIDDEWGYIDQEGTLKIGGSGCRENR